MSSNTPEGEKPPLKNSSDEKQNPQNSPEWDADPHDDKSGNELHSSNGAESLSQSAPNLQVQAAAPNLTGATRKQPPPAGATIAPISPLLDNTSNTGQTFSTDQFETVDMTSGSSTPTCSSTPNKPKRSKEYDSYYNSLALMMQEYSNEKTPSPLVALCEKAFFQFESAARSQIQDDLADCSDTSLDDSVVMILVENSTNARKLRKKFLVDQRLKGLQKERIRSQKILDEKRAKAAERERRLRAEKREIREQAQSTKQKSEFEIQEQIKNKLASFALAIRPKHNPENDYFKDALNRDQKVLHCELNRTVAETYNEMRDDRTEVNVPQLLSQQNRESYFPTTQTLLTPEMREIDAEYRRIFQIDQNDIQQEQNSDEELEQFETEYERKLRLDNEYLREQLRNLQLENDQRNAAHQPQTENTVYATCASHFSQQQPHTGSQQTAFENHRAAPTDYNTNQNSHNTGRNDNNKNIPFSTTNISPEILQIAAAFSQANSQINQNFQHTQHTERNLSRISLPTYRGKNDKRSAFEFLDLIKNNALAHNVDPFKLVNAKMPISLIQDAKFWWQANSKHIFSFDQFQHEFMNQFAAPDFKRTLRRELDKRTQHRDEELTTYINKIHFYYTALGEQDNKTDIVNRVLEQMNPTCRAYARGRQFGNLRSLMRFAQETQIMIERDRTHKPPPRPEESVEKSLAFFGGQRPPSSGSSTSRDSGSGHKSRDRERNSRGGSRDSSYYRDTSNSSRSSNFDRYRSNSRDSKNRSYDRSRDRKPTFDSKTHTIRSREHSANERSSSGSRDKQRERRRDPTPRPAPRHNSDNRSKN